MRLRDLILATGLAAVTGASALALGDRGPDEPHRRLVIGGDCVGCNFEGANLANAQFLGGDFSNANFSRAELLGARINSVTLDGANLEGASLIDARLDNVSLNGAQLSDVRLGRARLHQVGFAGADMSRMDMSGAVLLLSSLQGASLNDARANDAVFRQVDMSGAVLREARFEDLHFYGGSMVAIDARSARFENAIIESSDLTNADFRGSRLEGVRFIAVNLTNVDFRGAEGLERATFRHVCGAGIQGLPGTVTPPACTEDEIRQVVASISIDSEHREIRRRELEQARRAIEAALAQTESHSMVGLAQSAQAELALSLQAGWEEAAQALADTQSEVREAFEGQWSFEIRRAEVGEPIQVILEQADRGEIGQGTLIIAPGLRPTPPAPPTPGGSQQSTRWTWSTSTSTNTNGFTPGPLGQDATDWLIETSSADLRSHLGDGVVGIQNVRVGLLRQKDGPDRHLLCGQIRADIGNRGLAWHDFAAAGSDEGFQRWIGPGALICETPEAQLSQDQDLSEQLFAALQADSAPREQVNPN